jgi:hypothetical protein
MFKLYTGGTIRLHWCSPHKQDPCPGSYLKPGSAPKPGDIVSITTGYDGGPLFGNVQGRTVNNCVFVGRIPGAKGNDFYVVVHAGWTNLQRFIVNAPSPWRIKK